jgi:hypothetical protein
MTATRSYDLKIKVILWLTINRPVCLGVKYPSGAQDQISITIRELRVCWCWEPSLTRERVCLLQLMLALSSAVTLGSESRGTRDRILLSQIRDSLNLEGQVLVLISPRNMVAQLYPEALGPTSCDFSRRPLLYNLGTDRTENTASNSSHIVTCVSVDADTCLSIRCLATALYSVSTAPPFMCHVSVLNNTLEHGEFIFYSLVARPNWSARDFPSSGAEPSRAEPNASCHSTAAFSRAHTALSTDCGTMAGIERGALWRSFVQSKKSSQVKVKVTLRLTVSQSVSLGIEPLLGPITR